MLSLLNQFGNFFSAIVVRFFLLFFGFRWGLYVCEAELVVLDAHAYQTALGELSKRRSHTAMH